MLDSRLACSAEAPSKYKTATFALNKLDPLEERLMRKTPYLLRVYMAFEFVERWLRVGLPIALSVRTIRAQVATSARCYSCGAKHGREEISNRAKLQPPRPKCIR